MQGLRELYPSLHCTTPGRCQSCRLELGQGQLNDVRIVTEKYCYYYKFPRIVYHALMCDDIKPGSIPPPRSIYHKHSSRPRHRREETKRLSLGKMPNPTSNPHHQFNKAAHHLGSDVHTHPRLESRVHIAFVFPLLPPHVHSHLVDVLV